MDPLATPRPILERRGIIAAVAILLLLPALVVALAVFSPLTTDPVRLFSGAIVRPRPGWLGGYGTIDPNMGYTAYALGRRAALDLWHLTWPLWNHFEGLGAPSLGEMQAAALFPPTLLLLLPHGQMLEQAMLQFVAGLGTFLFLRRFGLGPAAALAGGVLFECNGVFAWLRNAAYSPVAFLPWLLWAVEALSCAVRDGRPLADRSRLIAGGALAAALALYAGFPETVYFYSLLVLGWCLLRAAPQPRLLGDLAAMAGLAALLSAPLLLAFGQFLREAEVGGHTGDLFRAATLPAAALLMHLAPYVYGPISAAPDPAVAGIWGSIGGYLGVMPLLLALAGLIVGWRRTDVWLLAGWTVLTVGASHGAPVLHAAFLAIPLAGIAAYARYADAGWIFACVTLAALFLDRLVGLTGPARRRIGGLAALLTVAIAALALALAWPTLASLWTAWPDGRPFASISLAAVVGVLLCFAAGLAMRDGVRARRILVAALLGEAVLAFLVPFASYPRIAGIDTVLIAYLEAHAGLQRVAVASGTAITPNFGSAFGIATINYDDLPVPARTAAYVHTHLDPDVSTLMFRPESGRAALVRVAQHLDGYRRAGVRYVLADDEALRVPAYGVEAGPPRPLTLAPGAVATLRVARSTGHPVRYRALGLFVVVGTYANTADGGLQARLCQDDRCGQGVADLALAVDNRPVPIPFAAPVALDPERPYTVAFQKLGGRSDVALWLWPGASTPAAIDGAPDTMVPGLALLEAPGLSLALHAASADVLEIPDPRPYASAPGCTIDADTRDRLRARCAQESRLTRLEVAMQGWTADVNGSGAEIVPVEETFQSVALPEGNSTIVFRYAPPFVRPALALASAGLVLCLALAAGAADRLRRRSSPAPLPTPLEDP